MQWAAVSIGAGDQAALDSGEDQCGEVACLGIGYAAGGDRLGEDSLPASEGTTTRGGHRLRLVVRRRDQPRAWGRAP